MIAAASTATIWTAIAVAGVGTFAMRASFLAVAHRLATVPPWAQRILRQIPAAALAALVLPALVRPAGQLDLWQPRLLAGAVAALVAWRTRSVTLTLALGMGVVMLFEQL